jgi:DNA-directed RNA polymerase specialized sigma24 family protein
VAPRAVRALPRARVATALAALAETDRLVLALDLLEGLTVLEIAGALKLKVREVEQRRVAALAAVTRALAARAGTRQSRVRRRAA